MNNLLEQWNEHIVRGNQLSRELEDFEGIMHVADMPESSIVFRHNGNMTTFIDNVLSPEKMEDIKRIVVMSLNEARMTKEIELEKLMGVRKPAYINPSFEAAVQDMEKSRSYITGTIEADKIVEGILAPDPVEDKPTIIKKETIAKHPTMNVEDVRRMYQDEGKSQTDIADYFGVSKSAVNNFIYLNHLARKKTKDDGFLDTKVEAKTKKERP